MGYGHHRRPVERLPRRMQDMTTIIMRDDECAASVDFLTKVHTKPLGPHLHKVRVGAAVIAVQSGFNAAPLREIVDALGER